VTKRRKKSTNNRRGRGNPNKEEEGKELKLFK
jgi:hypothetical protein